MVAIDPLVSNAIGGIKLQVRLEDEEHAKALVAEIETNNSGTQLGDVLVVNNQKYEKTLDESPTYESDDIYVYKQSFFKNLFSPFAKRGHYCQNCKLKW